MSSRREKNKSANQRPSGAVGLSLPVFILHLRQQLATAVSTRNLRRPLPGPYSSSPMVADCSGVDKKPPVTSPSSGNNIQQILARLLLLAAVPAAEESVVVSATVAENSRVGVGFSGRQSPGRHNVNCGLCSAMKVHNPGSVLFGFIGGTGGLFAERTLEIIDDVLMAYKNQGFDLLGQTKDQIKTTEQVNAAMSTCQGSHPTQMQLSLRSLLPSQNVLQRLFKQKVSHFLMDDLYINLGRIQSDGPDWYDKTFTLHVEDQDYMGWIKKLQEHIDKVKSIVEPGCSQDILKAALSSMTSATDKLSGPLISSPSSGYGRRNREGVSATTGFIT